MLMEAALLLNIMLRWHRQRAHDFTFERSRGMPLADIAAKRCCWSTPRHNKAAANVALQDLWETYRDRGLVVLGVPSDDFGRQGPGTQPRSSNSAQSISISISR